MYKPIIILLHFILLLSGISIRAQEVAILEHHVNVDVAKQLILINKDLEVLNNNYPGSKTAIVVSDHLYTFGTPVLNFEKGISYPVLDPENNAYLLYQRILPGCLCIWRKSRSQTAQTAETGGK